MSIETSADASLSPKDTRVHPKQLVRLLGKPHQAKVLHFDEKAGQGIVRLLGEDISDLELYFHAVVISDGSRHVELGAPVIVEIGPGHLGRWEVEKLEKLPTRP